MAIVAGLRGVQEVLKNMKKAEKKKKKGLEIGLVKAGLLLQRASQQIVPVDTGALRASAFTRKENKGLKTSVRVGYTKNYAIFVHENLEANHAPGKTAKYLERPAREKVREMSEVIRREIDKA